jgi:hypothetical protein
MKHRLGFALIVMTVVGPAVAVCFVLLAFGATLKSAEQVIVGRVARLNRDSDGRPLAEVDVLETWRGQPASHVVVNVSQYEAGRGRPAPVVGDRALLLLSRHSEHPWPMLAMHGYGYLPVITLDGQDYVRGVWSNELKGAVKVKDCDDDVECYQLAELKQWAQAK